MRAAGRCAFCGVGGSSEEDVFAKWIAPVVGGDVFYLDRMHGRSKTNLRYLGLTSRAPCRKCNNEWMSRFEETAKPLLMAVIQGRPAKWESVEDRTIVARWAFKTALMLDRSHRPQVWTAPDKDFGYLFKHQEPPSSVNILLAHYLPQPGEEAFAVWAGLARASGTDEKGLDFKGYRITFGVGQAIFRVYGHADRDREGWLYDSPVWIDGQRVDDAFRRLWPLTEKAHEWPPRGANFSTSGLSFLDPLRGPEGR